MMKTIEKTSVFPAPRREIFKRIQKLETLQYIARPYAVFKSAEPGKAHDWTPGSTSKYHFKLFGLIPLGVHTIHIVEFCEDRIISREGNRHVPVWNHTILMKEVDGNHTRYTDRVEIDAGWKTLLVWMWAKSFYSHRQSRWINLLMVDENKAADPEVRIWDRFAPVYAPAMMKDAKIYRQMYRRIREVIKGKRVLELACGPGLIAKHVADVAESMVATDFSNKMLIQAAKGKNPDNLVYEWADASDLKYDDESFDVVIIGNALHVVPQPDKVLAEIKRVLKPDGLLIAPTFIHKEKDGATALTSRILEMAGIRFNSKWSEDEFRAFLEKNGFAVQYSEILKASINEMYVECTKATTVS